MTEKLTSHNRYYDNRISTRQEIAADWLAGQSKHTRQAYRDALLHFAQWLGEPGLDEVASRLISLSHGDGNAILLKYKISMRESYTRSGRKLSPATINLRLSAIRSMVKLARRFGLTGWVPEVSSEKVSRDSAHMVGPEVGKVKYLLSGLKNITDARGLRDYAIVRLMTDLGLRRGSVISLDLENINLEGGTIRTRIKGRAGLDTFQLPPATNHALAAWVRVRVDSIPAAFIHLSPNKPTDRLTGRGLAMIVETRSIELTGTRITPHGLRHAFATRARDLGIPIDEVATALRHSDLSTVRRYDDARSKRDEKVGLKVAESYGI